VEDICTLIVEVEQGSDDISDLDNLVLVRPS
jgi:hypothetical protein